MYNELTAIDIKKMKEQIIKLDWEYQSVKKVIQGSLIDMNEITK